MFKAYIRKNKATKQNAITKNLLKISDDGTKIECIDSPKSKEVALLLNDNDADNRRYAQWNFALLMLNQNNLASDNTLIQPVESLKDNLHSNDKDREHVFDLSWTFNSILIKKNRQLLKIIFQNLDIKIFSFIW